MDRKYRSYVFPAVVLLSCLIHSSNADDQCSTKGCPSFVESTTVQPKELPAKHVRHRDRRNTDNSDPAEQDVQVDFSAHGRLFEIRLAGSAHEILHKDFEVIVVGPNNTAEKHGFDTSVFYHGHLRDVHQSYISGHISDGIFVGSIHTPEDQYFIEKASKYIPGANFSNIIYRGSDIAFSDHDGHNDGKSPFEGNHYTQLMQRQEEFEAEMAARDRASGAQQRKRRVPYSSSKNTCEMAIVGDHELMAAYGTDAQAKTDASRDLIGLLDGASLIYRITQFSPGGTTASQVVQFSVKKIYLYPTETGSPLGGGVSLCPSTETGCTSGAECAQPYLDALSDMTPPDNTLPGWDDFCLVHAFTHRDWCLGILGLAWVGRPDQLSAGICARNNGGRSLNTGVSTNINFAEPVSVQMQTITLAHELGHNFGSNHDTQTSVSSTGQLCTGTGSAGNFIMYLKATDGTDVNNNRFSPCSIEEISDVIFAQSSNCFVEKNAEVCGSSVLVNGSCGNGIIDLDEECECTAGSDPCCDCGSCRIQVGKECSPTVDSVCCDATCMLKGLSLEDTMAAYQTAFGATTPGTAAARTTLNNALDAALGSGNRCGSSEECYTNRYCIKDTRFVPYKGQDAGYCPSIDFVAVLDTPVNASLQDVCFNFSADGCDPATQACENNVPSCHNAINDSSLGDCFLFHMSSAHACNAGKNLCRYNGCTGSICSQYTMTDGSGNPAEPCRLDGDNVACDLACVWNASDGCVSTKEYVAKYGSATGNVVTPKDMATGRTCSININGDLDRYGGRCNEGTCQELSTDISNEVSVGAVTKWIEDNWPIVLGFVLGAILLGILLKYTYVKKKPQIKKGMAAAAATIRRRTGMQKTASSTSTRAGGLAGRPPLTSHMRNELRQKMKKEEAIERLMTFFPKVTHDVAKHTLKMSRNEEEAVKRLLKRGYPFAVPTKVPLLEE